MNQDSFQLRVGYIDFGFRFLGFGCTDFSFRLLGFEYMVSTFGSWVLDRYRSGFHFEFLVGFLFRTSIEWVSLSDFCQIE
ncbi:unnamed protein product [Rhizophagus irregularis]|nr:unnamed protein product [Rhizophagus irregularis]